MRCGKRFVLTAVGVVLLMGTVVVALNAGPGGGRSDGLRVVKVEGVGLCTNFSRTLGAWLSAGVGERSAGLLARDGDILWVMGKGAHAFPYRERDGRSLTFDDREWRLLLGERTVALELESDTDGWEWLKTAKAEDLAAIRMIALPDELDTSQQALLKKIGDAAPNAGVAAEGQVLAKALAHFTPSLLVTKTSALRDLDEAQLTALRGVWFLSIELDEGDSRDLNVLPKMPALRQVWLSDWDPAETGPFPQDCKRLTSLVLAGVDAKDLAAIAHLTGLVELGLAGDDLVDISVLANLTRLETLNLTVCEKVTDLSVLGKLPNLKRVSLPTGVTQAALDNLVKTNPRLRGVELVGCEKIQRLDALRNLPDLKSLAVVSGTPADLGPIEQMKGLRFLVLEKDVFDSHPQKIQRLEKALPNCTIVAGGGLCLGSGWIVLLLPAASAAWLVARRRRKRRTASRRPLPDRV